MTSWFFIEMAAKSALICSIALLLAMALRNRAAADRSMVLRVGAGLLVALPLIDMVFPVIEIEAFAAPALPFEGMSQAQIDQMLAMAATLPPVAPTIWDDPTPLIMILWGAGALAVLARLAIGLATLNRWTRAAEPVTDPHWLNALERARVATGASVQAKGLNQNKAVASRVIISDGQSRRATCATSCARIASASSGSA